MSLLEPPNHTLGTFDESSNERRPLLENVDRPPALTQTFPGEPVPNPASTDIQLASAHSTSELRIEDTSQRGRRVKGAINRINYWAANSNSCYIANEKLLGQPLMPFCCCGGGQGSGWSDLFMLSLYVWFSLISPGIAMVGLIQIGVLVSVGLEWAIVVNNFIALASLCYIADLQRRNLNRFIANPFCIPIASGLLPDSLNAFMTMTVSNINRVQLLGIRERRILGSLMEHRQDASLHIMFYSGDYIDYVYTKPRKKLAGAIIGMLIGTLSHIGGVWWDWDKFGAWFPDGMFS